jgi:hypothetical protein
VRLLARLVVIAALGATASLGWSGASQAQVVRREVVLVAVPGLLWSDVATMPALRDLAERSSVGELSVKTQGTTTRCAAGLLAVSAGNRTSSPTTACAVSMATWPAIRARNAGTRYRAAVGSLGQTLRSNGVPTVAVGPLSTPMLADYGGQVSRTVPTLAAALRRGGVIATVAPDLYDALPAQRAAAQSRVDSEIASIVREVPPSAMLVVAGISDLSTGQGQLHAVVISGPGWTHTQLRSSAAGRAPYVQLIDLAPTILAAEGIARPSVMVGQAVQRSGSDVPSIASYVDDNRHAMEVRTLGQRVFLTMGLVTIAMLALASMSLGGCQSVARGLARWIAPAAAMTSLLNAFPWWRWPQTRFFALFVLACTLIAVVTTLVGRKNRTAGALVAPGFTFLVLVADQLTGSHLQLSAPLGDSPIIAGRFSGMGNLDFAAMATAATVLAGVTGAAVTARRSRLAGGLLAAAFMVVAVIADGAPSLGNDIGGVLALIPAGIVVVAMVTGVRLSLRRAIGVAVVTVVVAVALALADYSRPPTSQTHVGRFVGQVLHGGGGAEVHRKVDSSLASFGLTIGTFVVAIAVISGLVSRERVRRALAASLGLRAAAIGSALVGVLGTILNDSGITIAAMAVMVGVGSLFPADLPPDPVGVSQAKS